MTHERGSMLPAFAGLVFVSLVILSLAVEIASFGVAYRQTADLADVAAESGASMIDGTALHNGSIVLDEPAAAREALAVVSGAGGGDTARVDVLPGRVCVSVTRMHETTALVFLAVGVVDVQVTSCAEPRTG